MACGAPQPYFAGCETCHALKMVDSVCDAHCQAVWEEHRRVGQDHSCLEEISSFCIARRACCPPSELPGTLVKDDAIGLAGANRQLFGCSPDSEPMFHHVHMQRTEEHKIGNVVPNFYVTTVQ